MTRIGGGQTCNKSPWLDVNKRCAWCHKPQTTRVPHSFPSVTLHRHLSKKKKRLNDPIK